MTPTHDPELELYYAWKKDPTPSNAYALTKAVNSYMDNIISATGGDPKNPVLKSKANMMFMSYLPKFDPNRSNLKNFIYSHMRGLNRVVGTDNNIIQIPESVVLDRIKLNAAEIDLKDSLGRTPSMNELANATGIPMKRIKKVMQSQLGLSEGKAIASAEGAFNASGNIVGHDAAKSAWDDYVYDTLPDRQKAIMERLYGMYGRKIQSPEEISKELGISRAAVSQHKKKIEQALADDAQYAIFGG